MTSSPVVDMSVRTIAITSSAVKVTTLPFTKNSNNSIRSIHWVPKGPVYAASNCLRIVRESDDDRVITKSFELPLREKVTASMSTPAPNFTVSICPDKMWVRFS